VILVLITLLRYELCRCNATLQSFCVDPLPEEVQSADTQLSVDLLNDPMSQVGLR